ncbi:MAG: hypothetical protein IIA88_06655 [Bacteroidetes bacterium]|nr:hypothetical protein [Bacteroidota bacterium]
MLAIKGIYQNGNVKLLDKVPFKKEVKVIVTFLPEEDKKQKKHRKGKLDLNDFNFFKSMEASKGIKGSLSDLIIEERRSE